MQTLWQDLRYGLRMLMKQKGVTAVAVLSLALGIGANTAIFSVVNAVLLRPLPYPDAGQLVRLFETVDRAAMPSERMEVAPANFLDWREQSPQFSHLAAYAMTGLAFSGAGDAERLDGALVTADFFAALGVGPVRGRVFTADDEQAQARLTVIGYDLWQRRLGGTEDIVGRTIELDGFNFTVIGVMPREFQYPRRTQIYELYRLGANQRQMREARFLKVIGRLRQDVTPERAQAAMSGLAARLAEQYPQTNQNWSVRVVPLLTEEVGRVKPALMALLGAVGLVLLIACANVASLLLARALGRQGEIGIRLALGAGRVRIVRQLLTESLLLSLLGGCAGLLFGTWALDGLLTLAPANLPRLSGVRLDANVLGFTILVAVVTGVGFGLAPVWQAMRQDVNASLKVGAGRITGVRRLFSGLVIAEVALTLVVLLSAGLLLNSLWRVQRVEPGVDVERLLTVTFEPPSARYNGPDWQRQRSQFWEQLSARVAALPGVEAVGAVDNLPLSGEGRVYGFRKAEELRASTNPAAMFQVTTPDYFRAVGIRVRQGRAFTDGDRADTTPVVIVNETMAHRFWPNESAVGKRIVVRNETQPREVVGVVSDVKHFGPELATEPEMYVPFQQLVIDVMPLVVRTSGDPASLAAAVRREVRAVDATVAIERVAPMRELLSASWSERRFTATLLSLFALVALALAAVGIYGVLAYQVTQRTKEIGVRLALGAQTGDVLGLVLKQGLRLAVIGIFIGAVAAFAVRQWLQGLLFEVRATDPTTFALIAALLLAVVFAACWFPARRAAKVDPMIALRCE